MIGPAEAVEAAATRTISPLLATATVATVAAIGVGALVGGIAVADHHAKPSAPPKAPSKPAAIVPATSAVSPMDSIDALRRVQVSAVTTIAAPAVPAEAPDGAIRVLPISRGSASEAISLTRAIPPLHRASEATSIRSPDDDHEGHGRNMTKGPPPWSHSHRHPASNHRGKGTDRG